MISGEGVFKQSIWTALGLLVLALSLPASARPVVDCPLRDAPFSIDTPLIDLWQSPAARSVVEQFAPRFSAKTTGRFMSTKPPTFAAIMTLRVGQRMFGLPADQLPALDHKLRALPVGEADKLARCARYEPDATHFAVPAGKTRLLLFEKSNGFKDVPSVEAAHAALLAIAKRKGWLIVTTEDGGVFTPAVLRKFDAVIWNNISGDVLTLTQRQAFENWMNKGGAYIGIHGSAGDPVYYWDWYADKLIGARFLAHPMAPQFQAATLIPNPANALGKSLPAKWTLTDEWYSFRTDPRRSGAKAVVSLDEGSYSPVGYGGANLRMGDHPIAWTNCIGRGRMFYSAIGHRPEVYQDPTYVSLLSSALDWAAAVSGKAECR